MPGADVTLHDSGTLSAAQAFQVHAAMTARALGHDVGTAIEWMREVHAATELYCHRNTVIYRMKQIEQLTGRSLTDPRDKMLLGLALMARHRG